MPAFLTNTDKLSCLNIIPTKLMAVSHLTMINYQVRNDCPIPNQSKFMAEGRIQCYLEELITHYVLKLIHFQIKRNYLWE